MGLQYAPGSGKTLLLIGQTYQAEFQGYANGLSPPAGSSHYGTIYLGTIEQGDDGPNNAYLNWIERNYPNSYVLIALSMKDNPSAGGYGSVADAVSGIARGAEDAEIRSIARIFRNKPNLRFLVRIGYEVSVSMFASASTYQSAYNRIADIIKNEGASNVDFVYHPVRGYNDAIEMYPGARNVDWVALSVFNNDVCLEVGGVSNCTGSRIDPNLDRVFNWAKSRHPTMIAEAAVQSPAGSSSNGFIDYLSRLRDVITRHDVQALAWINSDWTAHGWPANIWSDSRIDSAPRDVQDYWRNNFSDNIRFISYSGSGSNPGGGDNPGGGGDPSGGGNGDGSISCPNSHPYACHGGCYTDAAQAASNGCTTNSSGDNNPGAGGNGDGSANCPNSHPYACRGGCYTNAAQAASNQCN